MDVKRAPPWNIDPIPFVVNPSALPPLFLRWMAGTLCRKVKESDKKAGVDVDGPSYRPKFPSVDLKIWVTGFNLTVANLVRNGYIETPTNPKDEALATLKAVFTPKTSNPIKKINPGEVPPPSGAALNKLYDRFKSPDANEKKKTERYSDWFESLAESLANDVQDVREDRRLRE